jgi:hypothetical protein
MPAVIMINRELYVKYSNVVRFMCQETEEKTRFHKNEYKENYKNM